jgi:hypothetical protein
LRHLKLAVDPPPIALARLRQETFGWASQHEGAAHPAASGVVRVIAGGLMRAQHL